MKRKLTLFLSAVMATSCLPMTVSAANFKDINDVAWAAGVINSVADKGLLSGYNDNTFRGKNNVTYCEAMQMIYTTLTKSGVAESMDAVTVYGYMQSLDALKVPKWAQMAVAYGLAEGIIDMQMVATKFAGGQTAATREDVAIIFGNAMGNVFGKERDTSSAQSFLDYWNISAEALEQVSVLKNLGIIKGDTYNRFNPKHNINRAEMAVMVMNTYSLLAEGISYSGEIVELNKNLGPDGTNYYYIAIKTADGHKEGFSVTEGVTPVYVGDTSETVSMGRLAKGDDVIFMISGTELVAIRIVGEVTEQGKYDVTGYVNSIKDNVLSLENENTGVTTKYNLNSSANCYVEGKKVLRKELEEIMKEHYKDYVYAGLNVEVKREKVDGQYVNVTYVKEMYLTFTQGYSVAGEVQKFTDTSITLKLADSSAQKTLRFAEDCKYFINDDEVGFTKAKDLASSGTAYAKATIDAGDMATVLILSADTFADVSEMEESKTYKLGSLSDKKMTLEDGGDKVTYTFGSIHPLENIQFYVWDKGDVNDKDDDEWAEEKNVSDVEKQVDTWEDNGETVYVRVVFNSGGRLSKIYLTEDRSAWKNSEDHKTERKGVIASVEGDVVKFKGSEIEYTLKKSYASGDFISGTITSDKLSKTFLSRLVNADNVEVYAEITANGDYEIIKMDARATAAEGKLLEFKPEERYIKIETADGTELKLASLRSPKLTDEEKDVFELEDLEGENSKYLGEIVTLGFSSNGTVNKITVGGGAKSTDGNVRVKGVATAASNGLKVEGDSTTYRWKSKESEISLRFYSGPSESLNTIKRMIDDPDVKVYVDAVLEESVLGDYVVESLKVHVKEASGILNDMDGTISIKTDKGNTFIFDMKNKLETCNVNGYGQDDVEDRDKGLGSYVKLNFNSDGDVYSVESK